MLGLLGGGGGVVGWVEDELEVELEELEELVLESEEEEELLEDDDEEEVGVVDVVGMDGTIGIGRIGVVDVTDDEDDVGVVLD